MTQTPGEPKQKLPSMPSKEGLVVMWLAMLGIVVTVAIAVGATPQWAAIFLSTMLGVLAVVRGLSRSPGPYGITTRSRAFDVTVLLVGAVVIVGLGVTAPLAA